MTPDDRDRIAELLQDPSLSYRAIGRELGISDWTVRRVARELDSDSRPMRPRRSQPQEPTGEVSALTSWLVLGVVVGFFALAIWAGTSWPPPPEL
jgi:transposase-like protein